MMRFRPLLVPTLIVVPALALMLALGFWQLDRLEWKRTLIDAVDSRLHGPAMPLEDALRLGLDKAEWRKVEVRGTFLHERETYLFAPGPDRQRGVQVITPLRTRSGMVLINRGFVPEAVRDPARRPESLPRGEVRVVGVLRVPGQPGFFTPAPDRQNRTWFSKDAASIAGALNLTLVAPIFVEAEVSASPTAYPRGGQTVVEFPNNHLAYAVTWFGLALALLAVYLIYHGRQGRLRFR